jgi:hypothetical protein
MILGREYILANLGKFKTVWASFGELTDTLTDTLKV